VWASKGHPAAGRGWCPSAAWSVGTARPRRVRPKPEARVAQSTRAGSWRRPISHAAQLLQKVEVGGGGKPTTAGSYCSLQLYYFVWNVGVGCPRSPLPVDNSGVVVAVGLLRVPCNPRNAALQRNLEGRTEMATPTQLAIWCSHYCVCIQCDGDGKNPRFGCSIDK
jgi:hypothetical protein